MSSLEIVPRGRRGRLLPLILRLGLMLLVIGASLGTRHDAWAASRSRSRKMARKFETPFGPELSSKNPASVRVQRIGTQLSRLASRQDATYSYRVIKNDKFVNAFQGPRAIYITTGLLMRLRNDAELALILGHETAHWDRRHAWHRDQAMQRLMEIREKAEEKFMGRNPSFRKEVLFDAVSSLVFFAISIENVRSQESEADAYGLRWISELGYNPRVAIKVLLRERGEYHAAGLLRLITTHPAPEDREASLLAEIDQEHLMDVARHHGGPRLGDGRGSPPEITILFSSSP